MLLLIGGNPVWAFEYIANNGLSTWSQYPYAEKVMLNEILFIFSI